MSYLINRRFRKKVPLTKKTVLDVVQSIVDPISGKDIHTAGLVRALSVNGDSIRFVLEIKPSEIKTYEAVRLSAEKALLALEGCNTVSIVLTSHENKKVPDLKLKKHSTKIAPERIPGVNHIIAIASGKGGVGKSTISANLACALVASGKKVGLLDADVYGPSQPRMLGVSTRPASPDGKTIVPLRKHGVTIMSLGLMINEDQAVVWRGPMLMGALQQMLMQVQWGLLDVLIVDLPPGTGDVQLSLAQKTSLSGAVIVSTPQDVALLDARKAVDMFKRLKTPLLGMVENMCTHICSKCGHEEHLFGKGGVAAEAKKLGIPLLAEIPLSLNLRIASDSGIPIVVSEPDSAQALSFRHIANSLIQQVID